MTYEAFRKAAPDWNPDVPAQAPSEAAGRMLAGEIQRAAAASSVTIGGEGAVNPVRMVAAARTVAKVTGCNLDGLLSWMVGRMMDAPRATHDGGPDAS